jgi:hypothetical protein
MDQAARRFILLVYSAWQGAWQVLSFKIIYVFHAG